MVVMRAVITNHRYGHFEWYAFIEAVGSRSSYMGKLEGARRYTSALGARDGIERTAERLGFTVEEIEYLEREYGEHGHERIVARRRLPFFQTA